MSKEHTIEAVASIVNSVDNLVKSKEVVNLSWHMKRLQEYADALFSRSPFQKGGRVRLNRTPDITKDKSWGWLRGKHFLVEGALGTIKTVDFRNGEFKVGVLFDDETWLSSLDGKTYPVNDKSVYEFGEGSLDVLATEPKFYVKFGGREIYLLIPDSPAVGFLLRNQPEKATGFATRQEAEEFIKREIAVDDPYSFEPEIIEK